VFRAEPDPSPEQVKSIAGENPANPFFTAQYIAYRQAQNCTPWILESMANDGTKAYCTAFMKTGRLRRSLEIPSIPLLTKENSFWQGLIDFCRRKGVSNLMVNSFASTGGKIPFSDSEKFRKARWEFVLNLKSEELFKKMRKGHSYSVKRAQKLGVELRRVRDRQAIDAHARMICASMQRRKDRDEDVSTSVDMSGLTHLVSTGAGDLFQAVLNDQVVSSNMILMAEMAGYNHTAGSSPEGMKCGAAHFLVHEIALTLRDEGKESLNLGGTENYDSGLAAFKTGFGMTTEIFELEAAGFEPIGIGMGFLQRAMER